MIEIVNIDKLSDDGFKQPANNPDLINPDNIKYSQLRYNTFASNQAVQGVAVVGSSSTFAFDISSSIPYTLFKLYKSTDGITYNEDKSYGGEIGRVPSVAGSGGSGSGGEQSGNVVRLIPSGTYELGKIYREISDAITYCGTIADIDTRMTIQIEGDGVGGDVETDFNVLPATAGVGTLAKWISYSGLNKSMTLAVVAETATYTGELDDEGNRVKITNLRINQTVQSITTTFENIDFSGCSFNADFPDGSFENNYEFVNCNFSACCNITASEVTFDSGCSGVFDNKLFAGLIVGTDTPLTVVSAAGYVTPQILQGVVSTLALTTGLLELNTVNGNWCDVTGSGSDGGLYLISMTNRTKGTEFYLKFTDSVILHYRFTPTGNDRGLTTKTGADRTAAAGELTKWVYDGTYVHEINIA